MLSENAKNILLKAKRITTLFRRKTRTNREPQWQFEKNLFLTDDKEGEIVLDILKGNKVGGIEFLSRLK